MVIFCYIAKNYKWQIIEVNSLFYLSEINTNSMVSNATSEFFTTL